MTTATLEKWLPPQRLKGVNSRTSRSYPSGTMWPHGEWSLGYAREAPAPTEWNDDPFVGLGVDDVAMAQRAAEGAEPLNLSDASNSHRPPRGGNGITGYGQQMIKALGFLMGEKFPRHRKTLGTITLPPMPPEARIEVVQKWSELTRELLQWLSRRLTAKGLPPLVCSVAEVQPKRLTDHGEGYLHWHLLWLNHPGKHGNWAIEPNDLRSWLESLLVRKVTSYPGGHVNVNTKRVEGEAARYLAKYMSKGKQQIKEAMEDWGEGVHPSTWWNMTKPARDWVKTHTSKGRAVGDLLDSFLQFAFSTQIDDVYAFLRHIEMEFDGVRYTVGWRGRFTDQVREDVRAVLKSADIG